MKKIIGLSLIATSLLIVGCGGGSSTPTSTTSAKITGTVPGTLIEAFCDNGYYAQVTSTQNGTNQHPFEIEVPTNTNCRLIMTTNENDPANRVITPIAFSNGATIVLSGDVDLGNIPLELSYQNSDDRDGDHVVDTPLNINPNGAGTNNSPVQDADGNGMVDAYDDDDDDNTPNAYEDDDNDGRANIHDDDDGDGHPDYLENDGTHDGNDNMSDNDNERDDNDNMSGNDNERDNNDNMGGNDNERDDNDTNHNNNDTN
jgi:hypothetical protein